MHPVYSIKHRQARRTAWQSLVAEWQQSGLKRSTFCRQHQLQPKDLQRWRYRMMRAESAVQMARDSIPALIPVQLAELTAAPTLSLQHCSGFTLVVNPQTDAYLFKQVTAWLQEMTC